MTAMRLPSDPQRSRVDCRSPQDLLSVAAPARFPVLVAEIVGGSSAPPRRTSPRAPEADRVAPNRSLRACHCGRSEPTVEGSPRSATPARRLQRGQRAKAGSARQDRRPRNWQSTQETPRTAPLRRSRPLPRLGCLVPRLKGDFGDLSLVDDAVKRLLLAHLHGQ